MEEIEIKTKKPYILFFSDLHLGVYKDSEEWHKIALDFADLLVSWIQEKDIDTLIFAGDVFDNRREIGVNTLHVAKKFFDTITQTKAVIYIIPGNHDTYLSNSADINSVEILENQNIIVFPTNKIGYLSHWNKRIGFHPWKTNLSDFRSKNIDLLVGHLEINNFKVAATKVWEKGYELEELWKIAPKIISGHFHIRDYRTFGEGKYILYVGTPYQLNFKDRGQERGATLIDTETLHPIEFLKNEISPKHFKIALTDLMKYLMSNKEALKKMIYNNFISISIDINIDLQTLNTLTSRLENLKPKKLRIDFDVFEKIPNTQPLEEKCVLDFETALKEFVDSLDDLRVEKDLVVEKCLELYNKCLTHND